MDRFKTMVKGKKSDSEDRIFASLAHIDNMHPMPPKSSNTSHNVVQPSFLNIDSIPERKSSTIQPPRPQTKPKEPPKRQLSPPPIRWTEPPRRFEAPKRQSSPPPMRLIDITYPLNPQPPPRQQSPLITLRINPEPRKPSPPSLTLRQSPPPQLVFGSVSRIPGLNQSQNLPPPASRMPPPAPGIPSTFHSPYDQKMASRQMYYTSMTPHERRGQEAWAQAQLAMNAGLCVAGWAWARVDGWLGSGPIGGYRCHGGFHFVTDELLVQGQGGCYAGSKPCGIGLNEMEWIGPCYSNRQMNTMVGIFDSIICHYSRTGYATHAEQEWLRENVLA